ncbi:prepilin-type N-terminal cleavage/methylation domain-containing protein [Candidatus Latescibacterota bacterium]
MKSKFTHFITDKFSDHSRRQSECGMTLIELLVATTIGLILITMIFQFFVIQLQNFNETRMNAEMQQELRWGFNFLSDHLKLAGNGVPPTPGFRVIDNINGPSGAPDSINVIGCYKSLKITTDQHMGNHGSTVKVPSSDGVEIGDLIVISYPPNGWQEIFLVTSINANHIWHMPAPPWNDDNHLEHAYPEGSICTVVTYYSFFVDTDDEGRTNLMVQSQAYPPQVLAGDIEDFQVRFKLRDNTWVDNPLEESDIRMMEITLRAKTPDPIKGYLDPEYGDEYKRLTLKSNVIPKNIVFVAD